MSFAYLQLYTGDYLRDTRALTPLDHGVYLLLLIQCWDTKGPLPLDEQDCAGIANCRSSTEIDALRKILNKFFIRMDDGWYNTRMQREIEKAENISGARSEAGKKGYQARAKQLPSKSQALASNPNINPILNPNINPKGSRITTTALPPEWLEFCRGERPDLDAKKTFQAFRDWWIAKPGKDGLKLDWFATWRNWVRNQHAKGSNRKNGVDEWLAEQNQTEKDITP